MSFECGREVEGLEERLPGVDVRLRVLASGRPIDTSKRPGRLFVGGIPVETGPKGRATLLVPVGNGMISGRYEPEPWWQQAPGHVGDTDTIFASRSAIDSVRALFGIGVPLGLLCLAAFLVDRITGIPIWPPWRL